MLHTKLTKLYGIQHPVVLAGMAFVSTAPLAAAVSSAGGLGILGATAMPPEYLRDQIRTLKATNQPYGIDIIARFSTIDHIKVCIEEKVPIAVFFWDAVPKEWLELLRAAGTKLWLQVGSIDEAKAAIAEGYDALVVQGIEAGGHNRSTASTFALLPAIIDIANGLPVIAAGGIADGRGVVAALALGADGVWVGTRFLASEEAYAHDTYKQKVVESEVHDTARHFIFGPEFANASVRGIRNEIVKEWEGKDNPPPYQQDDLGELPVIGKGGLFGQEIPMQKFSGFPPTPEMSGDFEQMNLLAGEAVGLIQDIKPAAKIMNEMITEAEDIIRNRLGEILNS